MRNKKTAPAAVTTDDIAALVMERDDLQRRLSEVKNRAAEAESELVRAIERNARLRRAIGERDALISHLRAEADQIKFSASMMRGRGFGLIKTLGEALSNMTSMTTTAAEVLTKVEAGLESAPAITTRID